MIIDTIKYGKGIAAKKKIRKGEIIWKLNGERISLKECTKRIKNGEESVTDPLQIGKYVFLDLDEFSRTFNHSCQPNAGLRKRSELFSLKDIEIGEEITYDYSTTVGPNISSEVWTMACNCGSKKCRKIIGNILTIPKHILDEYKKNGALQDYIKNILKKKENV